MKSESCTRQAQRAAKAIAVYNRALSLWRCRPVAGFGRARHPCWRLPRQAWQPKSGTHPGVLEPGATSGMERIRQIFSRASTPCAATTQNRVTTRAPARIWLRVCSCGPNLRFLVVGTPADDESEVVIVVASSVRAAGIGRESLPIHLTRRLQSHHGSKFAFVVRENNVFGNLVIPVLSIRLQFIRIWKLGDSSTEYRK